MSIQKFRIGKDLLDCIKISTVSTIANEDDQLLEYLVDHVSRGSEYFRAKYIADVLGLSAKQVGARLARLSLKTDGVQIEKWGRGRSTTWKVTLSD